MTDLQKRIQFLQGVRPFADLPRESLAKLSRCMKEVLHNPQEILFQENSPGGLMCIIKSGKVEVRRKDPATGINFLVATRKAGDSVGEMSLLTGKPRTATVTAVEPTDVFEIRQQDFDRLLQENPEIARGLAGILAERLHEASQRVGLDFINLNRARLDPQVVRSLPEKILRTHEVVPVALTRSAVSLAMVNPLNLNALDEVRQHFPGRVIEPLVCTEDDFREFMKAIYPLLAGTSPGRDDVTPPAAVPPDDRFQDLQDRILALDAEQDAAADSADPTAGSEAAPVVQLVNDILSRAVMKQASDIHLEPQRKGFAVRYRVDGDLRDQALLAKKLQRRIVRRLKAIAGIDASTEPKDGRLSLQIEGRSIDFRVSTVPAKFGDRIVLRVLDKEQSLVPLDKLFTDTEILEKVREVIRKPHGVIYVTGPTGSGKTTTLYSALKEVYNPEINIMTLEDPIEYDLEGVSQVEVRRDSGLTFASILRALLRQDPDIMLIGETRDSETAAITVEAALTGHLVFTTLHANDAPGAFTRLEDLGIAPFLMAESTQAVLAQRLVKRICQSCKTPATTAVPATLTRLGFPSNAPPLYRGAGCTACRGTGYKGRAGIYELLVMTPELRSLLASGAKAEQIREAAVRAGMKTLKDSAHTLLAQGVTTVEEVLAAVSLPSEPETP